MNERDQAFQILIQAERAERVEHGRAARAAGFDLDDAMQMLEADAAAMTDPAWQAAAARVKAARAAYQQALAADPLKMSDFL